MSSTKRSHGGVEEKRYQPSQSPGICSPHADSCWDRPFFPTTATTTDDISSTFNPNAYAGKPVDTLKASPAEKLLVAELNEMSLKDRNRMYEEINGVALDAVEDPAEVQTKLEEMEGYIRKTRTKKAYDRANLMNPRYTQDRKLRIMFLRATDMDSYLSAKNMVQFFEWKQKLWGVDRLVRNIVWEDLSEAERNILHAGCFQLFPSLRDNMNRVCYFSLLDRIVIDGSHAYLRIIWYATMQTLWRCEDVQRKGIVGCCYCLDIQNAQKYISKEFLVDGPILKNILPFRYVAMHACCDSRLLQQAMSLISTSFNKSTRVRFRAHLGNYMECQYELMSYGLLLDTHPIDAEGALKKKQLLYHLEQLRNGDQHSPRTVLEDGETPGIDYPTSLDVVLGKGRPYQDWPGNVGLAQMVDERREAYTNKGSNQQAKRELTALIVRSMKEAGGRFLKRVAVDVVAAAGDDPADATAVSINKAENENDALPVSLWCEVDAETARLKVSHLFRCKPRQAKSS